jgi:hypothetical protein
MPDRSRRNLRPNQPAVPGRGAVPLVTADSSSMFTALIPNTRFAMKGARVPAAG